MDIEDVVAWAFRDELPKGYRAGGGADNVGYPSMSPMFSMVAMGGRVDNWSREPGFPAAMGEPHPDALTVAAAVERLAQFAEQDVDGDIGLMPDLAAFGVDEVAAMKRALPRAASIVICTAKSGRRPYWCKKTTFRPVHFDNGKPSVMAWEKLSAPKPDKMGGGTVEWDELRPVSKLKNGTYPTGAHCILTYSPDPKEIAEERAEYALWWSALDALAVELVDRLKTIAVVPPQAAQRPWAGDQGAAKRPKVVPDLSGPAFYRQQRETLAAYRHLGQRRVVGARNAAAARMAPRRVHVGEAMAG